MPSAIVERLLLALEFGRLDELVGLHNFDDCALYGYALKLHLLERQHVFRRDEGIVHDAYTIVIGGKESMRKWKGLQDI